MEYDLECRYNRAKSFYGKARVLEQKIGLEKQEVKMGFKVDVRDVRRR